MKLIWSPQKNISGVGSSAGPQMAVFGGKVYAAWKGVKQDEFTYYASFDGKGWSGQAQLLVQSNDGPSLAFFNNHLYMAWPGCIYGDDGGSKGHPAKVPETGNFYLSYGSFDGNKSIEQDASNVPNLVIGERVSIATFRGELYAAFRGRTDDDANHWVRWNGSVWSSPASLAGGASSVGPTLAVFRDRLYAIWPGIKGDAGIYWVSFDGGQWSAQAKISGVGTSWAVGLGALPDRLVAAWKGAQDDGIYCSSLNGNAWLPQQPVGGIGSSHGPQFASYNNELVAAWVGNPGDDGIYWATVSAA